MTDGQWNNLLEIVKGKVFDTLPMGFIIDCPWLPNWYGINILDYFTNDDLWIKSNIKAIETFPDVMFIPGFWSEYGMCSEPSAFGVKCTFPQNEFPHADKCIFSVEDIDNIKKPKPEVNGLGPFLLNRLKLNRQKIEDAGHKIRFSVSRGHLNIASYLMGTTEFLMAMMTNPDKIHKLLHIINDYLKEWHALQRETFPTIDGIMVLDDIIGFVGEEEFKQFGLPYLKELYDTDVNIKLLHNDADCSASVKYLPEIGINMFNMAFDTSLNDLKDITGNKVTMLGNIPPRDVLAGGSTADIEKSVKDLIGSLKDKSRIIVSCGGGMPPAVSTEQIKTFIKSVKE
jgi:uroporphyrinogen-III decarboxylase